MFRIGNAVVGVAILLAHFDAQHIVALQPEHRLIRLVVPRAHDQIVAFSGHIGDVPRPVVVIEVALGLQRTADEAGMTYERTLHRSDPERPVGGLKP